MYTRRTILAALLLVGVLAGPANAGDPLDPASCCFFGEIARYLVMRNDAALCAPPPGLTENPEDIERATVALADAIRRVRSTATPGEILALDVGISLRERIALAMKAAQIETSDLLWGPYRHPGRAPEQIAVNGRYPWIWGSDLPAPLANALPVLPGPLEFRLLGSTLVLVDVEAALIVDILPNALPLIGRLRVDTA